MMCFMICFIKCVICSDLCVRRGQRRRKSLKAMALRCLAPAIAQRFEENFGDLGFESHITTKVSFFYDTQKYVYLYIQVQ